MSRAYLHRIVALEATHRTKLACQRCYGRPVRIVTILDDTDAVLHETFPESGCPECGRPVSHTLRIVGETSADAEVLSNA